MDESEFDDFYVASVRRVTLHVYARTGDWDEAQDCAQEAFAKAWSHRSSLDLSRHPEAWVRTTAQRLAVSRWRSVMRRRRRTWEDAPSESSWGRSPDADSVALVRALRQLPEPQRRALVLHYLLDLPLTEVAAETDAPIGTVKARLSRGRTALGALLGDELAPAFHDQEDR